MQNKVNFLRFLAQNEGGQKKQTQSPGFGGSRQIRNPKREARNKAKIRMPKTRAPRMSAPRKTKPIGAAGGRDWGLRIANWGFEIRDTLHEIRIHRVDAARNKPHFRSF
jgi:hypothetical protein